MGPYYTVYPFMPAVQSLCRALYFFVSKTVFYGYGESSGFGFVVSMDLRGR